MQLPRNLRLYFAHLSTPPGTLRNWNRSSGLDEFPHGLADHGKCTRLLG